MGHNPAGPESLLIGLRLQCFHSALRGFLFFLHPHIPAIFFFNPASRNFLWSSVLVPSHPASYSCISFVVFVCSLGCGKQALWGAGARPCFVFTALMLSESSLNVCFVLKLPSRRSENSSPVSSGWGSSSGLEDQKTTAVWSFPDSFIRREKKMCVGRLGSDYASIPPINKRGSGECF